MAGDVTADVYALVRDLLPVLLPGSTFDPDDGAVVLPLPEGRARISAAPLVRACSGQPSHTWPTTVDEWLKAVRAEVNSVQRADHAITPEQLRIRITPRQHQPLTPDLVAVPYGNYFDAVVVIDHPTRIETLTQTHATHLGIDPDETVNIAIRQTVAHELLGLDSRDHQLPGGEVVRMLARDNNPYVTSALLSVPRFLPGKAPHGALLAVPAYSTVLLHEITSNAVLDFVVIFQRMTQSLYAEAADSCTPQVFWWADGTLHQVTIEPTQNPQRPRVTLPPDLANLVRQLPDSGQRRSHHR